MTTNQAYLTSFGVFVYIPEIFVFQAVSIYFLS